MERSSPLDRRERSDRQPAMSSSRRYELGVGCLLFGALVVLGWMSLQVGALASFGDRVEVEAAFADANGLSVGAVVAIAGVEIGTVSALRVDHDLAVASLSLNPSAGVRSDALAMVRARSVLGEKYVEIVPRSRDAALAVDGDTLKVEAQQVEIDELVNALGPLVGAIDPATVQRVAAELAKALEDDPARLSRMLQNTDRLIQNSADASDELPQLVREGRAAVREGRAVLGDARGTLAVLEARAAELEGTITLANSTLADAKAAVEPLPALVSDGGKAVQEARDAIARLDGTLETASGVVDNFSEFDRYELRRLLREEGILVRLRPREVDPTVEDFQRQGKVK